MCGSLSPGGSLPSPKGASVWDDETVCMNRLEAYKDIAGSRLTEFRAAAIKRGARLRRAKAKASLALDRARRKVRRRSHRVVTNMEAAAKRKAKEAKGQGRPVA